MSCRLATPHTPTPTPSPHTFLLLTYALQLTPLTYAALPPSHLRRMNRRHKHVQRGHLAPRRERLRRARPRGRVRVAGRGEVEEGVELGGGGELRLGEGVSELRSGEGVSR